MTLNDDYLQEEMMIQNRMEQKHLTVEVEWKMDEWFKTVDDVELKLDQWLNEGDEHCISQ
ncbi:metG [Acrasis kona]|uniref:MetG n=1 Tax=Acrasis kona TaxID=1008807 RepID=A0AAW2Z687_9EUKA